MTYFDIQKVWIFKKHIYKRINKINEKCRMISSGLNISKHIYKLPRHSFIIFIDCSQSISKIIYKYLICLIDSIFLQYQIMFEEQRAQNQQTLLDQPLAQLRVMIIDGSRRDFLLKAVDGILQLLNKVRRNSSNFDSIRLKLAAFEKKAHQLTKENETLRQEKEDLKYQLTKFEIKRQNLEKQLLKIKIEAAREKKAIFQASHPKVKEVEVQCQIMNYSTLDNLRQLLKQERLQNQALKTLVKSWEEIEEEEVASEVVYCHCCDGEVSTDIDNLSFHSGSTYENIEESEVNEVFSEQAQTLEDTRFSDSVVVTTWSSVGLQLLSLIRTKSKELFKSIQKEQ